MKKLLLVVTVLISIQYNHFAQTIKTESDQIILGAVDSVYSETLSEKRTLWIYVPRSASNPNKKYPVLYLLDGIDHFYSVSGMLRQLSAVNGNTILPEMIVVAIPNTNRTRDLTPSAVKSFPNSGGSENFTTFLEKELIPFIDNNYPTTPYRTLVGHSWGGLFAVNTLIHHPDLFDNYVSIDPSIRWDNQSFLKEACMALEKNNFNRKSLYLGIANRIPKGFDLSTVLNDTTKASEHMRTILLFANTAERAQQLNFEWKFYQNDNHLSVPLIAEYDAFRSLFPWYGFNEEILFDTNSNWSDKELIDLINTHYDTISEHFGYAVLPPENILNRYGDIFLLFEKQYDIAYAFYNLNVENYPESANVYDAMGDYYVAKNEKNKAIDFFEKALAIQESVRTREKLTSLIE